MKTDNLCWSRLAELAQRAAPWLLFAALLAWGWRTTDLIHAVPASGDVMESLWGIKWFGDALRLGRSPALYLLAFHPGGWRVATFALGPATFVLPILLLPLGGAAFAYNVTTLITFAVAFAGMYKLAGRLVTRLGATVAALLYTFWGFRWYNITAGLNISLASALLPWIIWCVDRGLGSPRRSWLWYFAAGGLWAICISSSLYFIWIVGIAVLGWLIGRLGHAASRRPILVGLLLILIVAGLLSLPLALAFWRARSAAAANPFTILDANAYSASVNSLPIPNLSHPWLQFLARHIYLGPPDQEGGMANLGLLASGVALVGIVAAWRDKTWRPVLILAFLGLILALGPVLKWNDRIVRWDLLRPLDLLVWKVGYLLKPEFFFGGPQPRGGFKAAVPTPGLLLSMLVPFFEQGRVFARYALVGGMAVFLLTGRGIEQLRHGYLRLALAAVLVFEVVPPPTASYVFPPPSHEAFDWLRGQSLGTDGIIEFSSAPDYRLELPIGGDVIWATQYHRQPTVSGASSVWPGYTVYLMKWLTEHPHPFGDPDFVPLLRFYGVRFVVLHMYGERAKTSLDEARQNEALRYVNCFSPASEASLWNYPICVLEVLPPPLPGFNLILREGWSGPEDWGRWVDGTEARAEWVATAQTPHRMSVEAFPLCIEGREQQISLEVNSVPLSSYRWNGCEPWSGEIKIPPDLVRIGSNEVTIRAAYGVRPIDITAGENKDSRTLSVGFTKLRVDEGS